ncbi:OmpA family protein [Microvirga splendida]|uniref:OmpA family protein n=1 Tax=Microvirga splendida TaxID=2795727 RepID=UPI001FEF6423|nr:OmpA family protein [Microvirga splendida]
MKLSSLFLASTALPLMLLPANVSALQPEAVTPLVLAQAGPSADEDDQPGVRRRPRQDADSPRGGGQGQERRQDAQERRQERQERRQGGQDAGGPGASEERGQRPPRGAGPAERGGPDGPRGQRATESEDAPSPRRGSAQPGERPTPPSGTTPATPARPAQGEPAERARPSAETPDRPNRPAAQERERNRDRPAGERERPRQPSPAAETPPSTPAPAAQPAKPPAPAQQRPAADAPRPADAERPRRQGDTERPDRDRPDRDRQRARDQRPGQDAPTTTTAPTAPATPAPSAPTAAPAAPTPAPAAPTTAAPAAPTGRTLPTVPAAPVQSAPQQAGPAAAQPLDPARVRIDDLRRERRERREGGRLIIEEPGNRTIIRQGDEVIIRHDETQRFRRAYRDADVRVERRSGNEEVTIVRRPDGTEIVTVRDEYGNLIRRIRREPAGQEVVLIENRRRGVERRPGYGYMEEEVIRLPPPTVRIPREEYIVETERASRADIVEAFTAPPVERVERAYTLDEVRRSQPLRERMRRVDLNAVTFEFGSWELPSDQIDALSTIAAGLREAISRNPNEIFLVEGHTDAVGSDEDNLTLSDRRAETIATILTERFQIPAENLTTQGYGEQYLKVATEAPERENRRVTLRRITPLLQGQNQQQ